MQNTYYVSGKQAFFVLRQREHTIQCVVSVGEKVSKQMVKFVCSITKESLLDVEGKVRLACFPSFNVLGYVVCTVILSVGQF